MPTRVVLKRVVKQVLSLLVVNECFEFLNIQCFDVTSRSSVFPTRIKHAQFVPSDFLLEVLEEQSLGGTWLTQIHFEQAVITV